MRANNNTQTNGLTAADCRYTDIDHIVVVVVVVVVVELNFDGSVFESGAPIVNIERDDDNGHRDAGEVVDRALNSGSSHPKTVVVVMRPRKTTTATGLGRSRSRSRRLPLVDRGAE